MADRDLRELERMFLAAPSAASALELARSGTRHAGSAGARTAFGWLLELGVWDGLDSQARTAAAQLLEARAGAWGLKFVALRGCEQQQIRREIALFRTPEFREFMLVPGGSVEIGYDPRTFDASELNAEMSEWAESERRVWAEDGPEAIEEAMERVAEMRQAALDGLRSLNPRRRVDLQPMLVEARPDTTWGREMTHSEVLERLRAEGYRLLRSDEWEYCCAAGTRTLFRWGDAFPQGEMDPEVEAPNAFGLRFHGSPAGSEFCLEPERVRNGDGGVGLCGGEGPVAFLPLSAWYERAAPFPAGLYRRVLDLGQCLGDSAATAAQA